MALFESLSALIGTKTAAAAAGLVIASGAAAGAADHLPDPLQDRFDAVTLAEAPERPDAAQRGQGEGDDPVDGAEGAEVEGAETEGAEGQGGEGQGGELPEGLPEQARADEVHEAIDSTEPGPERGAAVSEAASGDAGSQGDAAREAGAANADGADDQGTEGDEGEKPEGGAANAEQRGEDRP